MKPRVNDVLVEMAHENLFPNGARTSQSGLTRTELRALERRGVIRKSYVKVNTSGALECFWSLA